MILKLKKKAAVVLSPKTNRTAALEDRNLCKWSRIDELDIPEFTPTKVWLKDLEIQVLLFKQVFKNKDGTTGVGYLVSNELSLTADDFRDTYKKRWAVEEYHKSIKLSYSSLPQRPL